MKSLPRWLEALLTPAIAFQENYYRQMGLRDRILNLPLTVVAVLNLLWRDVAQYLSVKLLCSQRKQGEI